MPSPNPADRKIYHVFLASPGDMADERQAVRDFFKAYNRDAANPRGFQFDLIDGENQTNIGVGRPQALITQQTLKKFRFSLALVIGLLGQRFGTPTGDFNSGTEEEFTVVMNMRREQGDYPEIKWFFRKGWGKDGLPMDPDELLEVANQKRLVDAFKERVKAESDVQLFTANFETTNDFPALLARDLNQWLNDPEKPWNQQDAGPGDPYDPPPDDQLLDEWLRIQAADCARLPLEVLDARQGLDQPADPIRLPDIFVPLKAVAPPEKWLEEDEEVPNHIREMTEGKSGKPVPVLDLLAREPHSVLIGDPGAGKSALVNQLAWQLSANDADAELPDVLQGGIPVRIVLRQVEIPGNAKVGRAKWLWQALETDIRDLLEGSAQGRGEKAPQVVSALRHRLGENPGGMILLDGLDEVPAAGERRTHLLQAIRALVEELPASTRIMLTARPYAYTDPGWRLAGFTPLFLTPFDEGQRSQFINGWYRAAKTRFGLREQDLKLRVPDMLERVENREHLRELARRPLLLTLIATLHASGGSLPEDRAELYRDSVNLLLYQWRANRCFRNSDGQPLSLSEPLLRESLQQLAWSAHKTQREQRDSNGVANISRNQLLDAFEPLLATLGRDDLLAYLEQHSGILISRGRDHYAFPHRSFQEYLAMGWLSSRTDDALSREVCTDPIWWRETFLLAVLEQRKKPRPAIGYIEDMLETAEAATATVRHQVSVLAGLSLMELGLTGMDDTGFSRQRIKIRSCIVELIEDPTALTIEERAEAGRVLGGIGDPRPGVGLDENGLPGIEWCEIPAADEVSLEDDAGTFPVEHFYLASYPVTNAQFQTFIDDDKGYQNREWWVKLDEKPDTPEMPSWSEPNHPRETVSWYEAMAFCAWLSGRLGYTVSLPTEWQWQQAASSGNARQDYPWGEEYETGRANINETVGGADSHYLRRTTAVGLYPQGNSAQEVSDLAGNVLEWCLNEYGTPANTPRPVAQQDACCAAGPGSTFKTTPVRRSATSTFRAAVTTIWVFG
ncbi:MAG: SUMF1/EgtB/PvdO family nonheme iron enzyme [gamma proteobacterium endosymbiont of Lamellibrachia anaximandri]|nr:SUMF1/EgtB/PvdO family nonheme iron enzyme [gamma proteobacterium endosymbiont of Lamellibrachia anaximandri]